MTETAPPNRGALPELPDETIDRMETKIFAQIATERADTRGRKRRRRRTMVWSVAAAAAVVVVGVATVPGIAALTQAGSSSPDSAMVADSAPLSGAQLDSQAEYADGGAIASDSVKADAAQSAPGTTTESTAIEPQIITTVSATITVTSIDDATAALTAFADAHDGYVASLSTGSYNSQYLDASDPAQPIPTYGSVTLRLPSAGIDSAITELGTIGTVSDTAIDRVYVTAEVVDVQARVDAYRTSVQRLQEIITQAGSLADVVAAEAALTERQATLDSYEQQLKSLTGQVELSTVSIMLSVPTPAVQAEPAGFTDGLLAGWNGLLATMNGLIIAFGFLLPWLVIAAIAGVLVWLVVRGARRRRAAKAADIPAAAPLG